MKNAPRTRRSQTYPYRQAYNYWLNNSVLQKQCYFAVFLAFFLACSRSSDSRARAPKINERKWKLSVFSPLVAFGLTAYDLTRSLSFRLRTKRCEIYSNKKFIVIRMTRLNVLHQWCLFIDTIDQSGKITIWTLQNMFRANVMGNVVWTQSLIYKVINNFQKFLIEKCYMVQWKGRMDIYWKWKERSFWDLLISSTPRFQRTYFLWRQFPKVWHWKMLHRTLKGKNGYLLEVERKLDMGPPCFLSTLRSQYTYFLWRLCLEKIQPIEAESTRTVFDILKPNLVWRLWISVVCCRRKASSP